MTLRYRFPPSLRSPPPADDMKTAGRQQDADDLSRTVVNLQLRRAEDARANAIESGRLLAMLVCIVVAIVVAIVVVIVCLILPAASGDRGAVPGAVSRPALARAVTAFLSDKLGNGEVA